MYTYNAHMPEIKVIEYPEENVIAYVSYSDIQPKLSQPIGKVSEVIENGVLFGYKDVPEEVWEKALLDGKKIVRMLARRDEIFPNEYMERYLIVIRNIYIGA